jgi:tRNA A-37 threonylcarbamoyl transferase component Bud32
MDLAHSEDEMFRPPKYFVNSWVCSLQDDDSQLEVRRYGKYFYITMAPENFVDSPSIKQQYLSYLAAERSDVTDDASMAEDYSPEDFYAWALEPCLPLLETVAPDPKQNLKITVHDFLHPEVFYYSLRAADGELIPVQSDGRGAGMLAPGLELDGSVFSPAWPSFLPTEVEICITNPEDAISARPSKVLVNGNAICFAKLYQANETNMALRELENYKRITESNLDPNVRICRLLGVIKDDENQLIGLLLTYIDCDFLTLACAVEHDTPVSTRQKWVDQVTDTLTQLHNAGLVWGDAKPDNILIDKNGDAWVIDFGGGYTRGYVEREKAGTVEGDLQGLEKIIEYVFSERAE